MKLKLDYDCDQRTMMLRFHSGLISLNRVRQSKSYQPIHMNVTKVEKTRKGWHVYAIYRDDVTDVRAGWGYTEAHLGDRADTLILQSILGSDQTRTAFDRRRIFKKEDIYNLMFSYKNGQQFIKDNTMTKNLNEMISKIFY